MEFYQHQVADLLDSKINLYFQIQSLKLLIFYMVNQRFVANLDYVILCFLLQHHQS